jgi:hypothetical protein
VGKGFQELQFMDGQRFTSSDRSKDRWMADLLGWHIQALHLCFEVSRIIDQGKEVGEWNKKAIIEKPADKAGVVIAALLSVSEYVCAGAQLGLDR